MEFEKYGMDDMGLRGLPDRTVSALLDAGIRSIEEIAELGIEETCRRAGVPSSGRKAIIKLLGWYQGLPAYEVPDWVSKDG